jgi:hypothetical protein
MYVAMVVDDGGCVGRMIGGKVGDVERMWQAWGVVGHGEGVAEDDVGVADDVDMLECGR